MNKLNIPFFILIYLKIYFNNILYTALAMTLNILTITQNDSVVLIKIGHINQIKLFVHHKETLLASFKITELVLTNTKLKQLVNS